MKLSEIASGKNLTGPDPDKVFTVFAIPVADSAVQVICKLPDGQLRKRLLGPDDTEEIRLPEADWGAASVNYRMDDILERRENTGL